MLKNLMYQKYYTLFLKAQNEHQHFAAHSHHYWPDVTREATIEYWDDSAKFVDHKWEKIFNEKLPQTQKLIAEILNISSSENITFAPNTHELLFRLISSLDWNKKDKIQILTTDSEFYSFERQIRRLQELPYFEIHFVQTEPLSDFNQRFLNKIQSQKWDMVFFSHVFFNSGAVFKDYEKAVRATNPEALVVMDAYHGFMAVPTDLKSVEDRLYYIAGSYKYAQGGEGCCFLISPKNQLRPFYTGWFANMNGLSNFQKEVGYSNDGYRLAGSTMDYTALYRLHSSLELFKKEKISVPQIHQHIQKMQKIFLEKIGSMEKCPLKKENLIINDLNHHGHFLTFELKSTEMATGLVEHLRKNKIICDSRKNRIRFGFGLYQTENMDLSALNVGSAFDFL